MKKFDIRSCTVVYHVQPDRNDPVPATGESLLFVTRERRQPKMDRVPFHVSVAMAMDGLSSSPGKAVMTSAPRRLPPKEPPESA